MENPSVLGTVEFPLLTHAADGSVATELRIYFIQSAPPIHVYTVNIYECFVRITKLRD